jgi:hypothetical protein
MVAQDAAYAQSLAADQAKTRAKEDEKRQARVREAQRREGEMMLEGFLAMLEEDEKTLDPLSAMTLRIRLPSGASHVKSFREDTSMMVVIGYCTALSLERLGRLHDCWDMARLQLKLHYPRRSYSLKEDRHRCLRDLNLKDREVVFIQIISE